MDYGKRIARNTTAMTLAYIGQKVLSFFYFAVIARTMGVEGTGRYFLATSFTMLFSVIADFGLAPLLIRETAKLREQAQDTIRSIIGAKFILSCVALLAINIVALTFPYPTITKQLIALASLSMILESWNLVLYGILRGWQRLEYEALGIIIGQATTVALGLIGALVFHSLHLLVIALVIGNGASFLWALSIVGWRLRVPLAPVFSPARLRLLAITVLPFALAAIFTRVTGFIDSILVSLLGTETMVGLYSVPFKVTFSLQFIPLAFAAALLPAMSALSKESHEQLARTYVKSTTLLFFLALPIALGIALLADPLIPLLFGAQYLPAVPAIRVMIFSIVFLFFNFPIGSLLVATNRQAINTTLLGVAMTINIITNIIAIPILGILGPALAALLANATLSIMGFVAVRRAIAVPLASFEDCSKDSYRAAQ